jgi:hypothetical protein
MLLRVLAPDDFLEVKCLDMSIFSKDVIFFNLVITD